MLAFWTALGMAWAGADAVVAIGDGLVAGPSEDAAAASPTLPGGWVAVLGDCLEERKPARYSVVNRARAGETVRSARKRLGGIMELQPRLVVVGLGAQEFGRDRKPDAFRTGLSSLVATVREGPTPPAVVLVGMVPPTLAQVEQGERQQAEDERTQRWNAVLVDIAAEHSGVHALDLWGDWPQEGAARGALTAQGWNLTDQGHARVAAAVCDWVVAEKWREGG